MTFNFQLKKYGSGNETKEKEEGESFLFFFEKIGKKQSQERRNEGKAVKYSKLFFGVLCVE